MGKFWPFFRAVWTGSHPGRRHRHLRPWSALSDCLRAEVVVRLANEYVNTHYSEYWIVEIRSELNSKWIVNCRYLMWIEYYPNTEYLNISTELNSEYQNLNIHEYWIEYWIPKIGSKWILNWIVNTSKFRWMNTELNTSTSIHYSIQYSVNTANFNLNTTPQSDI